MTIDIPEEAVKAARNGGELARAGFFTAIGRKCDASAIGEGGHMLDLIIDAALAAALPHIEKAIREKCAAIADEYEARWRTEAGERQTTSQTYAHARADSAQSIAAAIRARKE